MISKNNKHTSARKLFRPVQCLAVLLPAVLVLLFYGTKNAPALMDQAFRNVTVPVAGLLTGWTSPIPFSLGEGLLILLVLWAAFQWTRGLGAAIRTKSLKPLQKPLIVATAVLLWSWAGFCWLWSIAYTIPGIPRVMGLERCDVSPEALEKTAAFFADTLLRTDREILRDEKGLFAQDPDTYFSEATHIYDELEADHPGLMIQDGMPKKLLFSRLQSHLGFSGFYFPYTGEANINADIPLSAQPFTLAHELAHQRLIASEDEADFLGVVACLSSGQPSYIYSGALAGLKMLAAPLNAQDPEAWQEIAEGLPVGVAADWTNSVGYWLQFKTPLEDWSRDVYDSFLKSQGQELGIRSYGACVDLLVNYCSSVILVNPYSE